MVEIVGGELVPVEVSIVEATAIRYESLPQVLTLEEVHTELLEIRVVGFTVHEVYSILERDVKAGQVRWTDHAATDGEVVDKPEGQWPVARQIDADSRTGHLSKE